MNKYRIPFLLLLVLSVAAQAQSKARSFYQLTVYHFASDSQQHCIDTYLKDAYLPAMHKKGFKNIGVFKPVANDTAADKIIYVLTPLNNLQQLVTLGNQLTKDQQYLQAGKEYLQAPAKNPPYKRMENIVLQAMELAPSLTLPQLKGPKTERIFELRSYEGPTESFYRNKLHMFNQGGEVALFKRLNFNAVFYGEVLAGSKMPNLMYMTSFENKADRDAHWKTFGEDPEWKALSSKPEYQNNVSHADIILTHPTEYSDI